MKVFIAQIKVSEDVRSNIEKIKYYTKEAVEKGADFIIFPEVSNTGFFPKNYGSVSVVKDEIKDILGLSDSLSKKGRSKKEFGILIVMGLAEKDEEENNLFSSAVIINSGKILGMYRKTKIFPLTDEIKYFSPGEPNIQVFNTPAGKIGLLICYEVRFPEISRELTYQGAQFLIIPAQFPYERISHWTALLRARAIENQIFVLGANCAGYGSSMIIDPWGEVLAKAEVGEELITADIDINELERIRKEYPFLKL